MDKQIMEGKEKEEEKKKTKKTMLIRLQTWFHLKRQSVFNVSIMG